MPGQDAKLTIGQVLRVFKEVGVAVIVAEITAMFKAGIKNSVASGIGGG